MNGEPAPNLVDLIDRLVDGPEPPPVSMLPQTWGWAAVGLAVLVLLVIVAYRALRRYRANAYRREALAELAAVRNDPAAMAAVLRRTALAAFPRQRVAALSGEAWLLFLDATLPGGRFATGPGRPVADAPYRRPQATEGLEAAVADWIRHHRPLDEP
ncbi:DUF4381 domain-containing protein [Marinivivus vitaminiproducens]|uniref:DUF4381 domain-containing protein n=1 Tax=Marinivivus vitaminiproducens TaxID=3035935 RepID=UPI00279FE0D9|nr:DUF4381 domain-containing protein [Geminicoccaceae bacterium SCSIO 64248]